MSVTVDTALTALGAAIAASAAASLFLSLIYPRLSGRLARIGPVSRSRILLGLMAAPVASGVAVGIINLTPLLDYGPVSHHCHFDSVPGCEPHAAAALPGGLTDMLLILLAASGLALLLRLMFTLRRLWRSTTALSACSRPDRARGVDLLDDPRPAAFSLGLVAPRIFVTTGLAEALEGDELDIVLGHEHAHARRRDVLRGLAGRVLARSQLPSTGQALSADLHLAAEQACDDEAAGIAGSRLDVASVLLKVERLCGLRRNPCPAGAHALMGSSVPARLTALMEAPETRRRVAPQTAVSIAVTAAVAVFLAAEPLHHTIEDLIHLLIG